MNQQFHSVLDLSPEPGMLLATIIGIRAWLPSLPLKVMELDTYGLKIQEQVCPVAMVMVTNGAYGNIYPINGPIIR